MDKLDTGGPLSEFHVNQIRTRTTEGLLREHNYPFAIRRKRLMKFVGVCTPCDHLSNPISFADEIFNDRFEERKINLVGDTGSTVTDCICKREVKYLKNQDGIRAPSIKRHHPICEIHSQINQIQGQKTQRDCDAFAVNKDKLVSQCLCSMGKCVCRVALDSTGGSWNGLDVNFIGSYGDKSTLPHFGEEYIARLSKEMASTRMEPGEENSDKKRPEDSSTGLFYV